MTRNKAKTLTQVSKADRCTSRASAWLAGIDRDTAASLGISGKISEALSLLRMARSLTAAMQSAVITQIYEP